MPNLSSRVLLPELMDDPNLPPEDLETVLVALRRVNIFSFTTLFLTNPIIEICRRKNISSPVIVDIGCGDGWLLNQVLEKLSKNGITAQGIGIDSNPSSTSISRKNFSRQNISFVTQSASRGFAGLGADFIISSLFLHHLPTSEIVSLLENASKNVKGGIVMVDLLRSSAGVFFAYFGTRLLTRSKVVHSDGVQSVKAGFSFEEFKEITKSSGLESCRVEKIFLSRLRLVWEQNYFQP